MEKKILKGEKKLLSATSNIQNACGKYRVRQSAFIIKNAKYVITHDTGMMHIAAALKKKIYSVWGNTIPAFGMSPYLANPNSKIIEVENLILSGRVQKSVLKNAQKDILIVCKK